jgi:hypothetical protein
VSRGDHQDEAMAASEITKKGNQLRTA